jgi:hypothetical protein
MTALPSYGGKPTSDSPGHIAPTVTFLAVGGLVSTLTGLHRYLELGLASGATAVGTAARRSAWG